MRARRRSRPCRARPASAATEVGDAVHRLLEHVDLADPRRPTLERVRAWYPARHRRRSGADRRLRRRRTARSALGRARRSAARASSARRTSPSSTTACSSTASSTCSTARTARALVVDYKTNALGDARPSEIVEHEYRLQRLVYALACFRGGRREVEVVYAFLERPEAPVAATFRREDVPRARGGAVTPRSRRSTPASSARSRSEFACAGCPALDLVCAGPRLRDGGGSPRPLVAAR